jgi:hypothetical protein
MSHYYKMSHAMMLDEPIGYAHHAPPMQKKAVAKTLEKSKGLSKVVSVVASVAAVASGWGMGVKAAWGGLAGLSGGAMMAGGVMSGVGAVTGNKKLAKIGGVLSLAGGIGSLGADLLGKETVLGDTLRGGAEQGMKSISESFTKATDALGFTKDTAGLNQTISAGGLESAASTAVGGVESAAGAQTISSSPNTGLLAGKFDAGMSGPVSTSGSIDISGKIAGALGDGVSGISGPMSSGSGANLTTPQPLSSLGDKFPTLSGPMSTPGSFVDTAKPGLLSQAWDFAKSPSGANIIGKGLEMMSGAAAAEKDAEQKSLWLDHMISKEQWSQAQIQQQLANLKDQVIYIDPYSPNAQALRQAAQASGKQVMEFGVNQNAPTQSPTGMFNQTQGAAA